MRTSNTDVSGGDCSDRAEPWKKMLDTSICTALIACMDGRFEPEYRIAIREQLGIEDYHPITFAGAPHMLCPTALGVSLTDNLLKVVQNGRGVIYDSLETIGDLKQILIIDHEKCGFLRRRGISFEQLGPDRAWHCKNRQANAMALLPILNELGKSEVEIFHGFAYAGQDGKPKITTPQLLESPNNVAV